MCLRDIKIVQLKRHYYIIQGESTALKGHSGTDRPNWTARFVIHPPSKKTNQIYDLPRRAVADLIFRRVLIKAFAGKPDTSALEFLASEQSGFQLDPARDNEPVFLAPTHGQRCGPLTLDATTANEQFAELCLKIGLPAARLYNFRKGAASLWAQGHDRESAKQLLSHERGRDAATNRCLPHVGELYGLTEILSDMDIKKVSRVRMLNTAYMAFNAPVAKVAAKALRAAEDAADDEAHDSADEPVATKKTWMPPSKLTQSCANSSRPGGRTRAGAHLWA